MLFAGSAAIVFAAITLVKAGEAHGLSVTEAATANAPVFLAFGKVTAISAALLLVAEGLDAFILKNFSRAKIARYTASILCCLCAFAFSFVIAPAMDNLLPGIANNPEMKESFQQLHKVSRMCFSGVIIFSWLSLVLPCFYQAKD